MQSHPFLIQVFIFAGKVKNVFFILPDSGLFLSSLWNGLFSHIVQLLNSQFRDSKGRTVASMSCYFLCNIKQVVFKSVTDFGECTERWARWQIAPAYTFFLSKQKKAWWNWSILCTLCALRIRKRELCLYYWRAHTPHLMGEKNPQLLLWVPNQLPNSVSDLLAPPAAR